jgi:transposase
LNYMDKHRIEVIQDVVSGRQSVQWAAAKLGRSEKTVKRYATRLHKNPADDLIHKNRGRKPVNRIDHERIWNLYKTKYYDCNTLFLCEKLEEKEGIKISEGTVRTVFKEHDGFSVNAWKRTKNTLKKRLRNLNRLSVVRKETLVQLETEPYVRATHPTQPGCKYFGEELQMDASEHLWFAQEKSNLHPAIDDATGVIAGAYFDRGETRVGYYNVTRQFLEEYGIPIRIKTDKRTVFAYERKNTKDMAEDTMTQYQQVCQTLGVELLCCSVPQFKPGVERSFKTLQGRLPGELKEAGVTTPGQANEFLKSYLKKFNKHFAVCDIIAGCWGAQPSADQIDRTLVTIARRVVDQGNAVRINSCFYAVYDSAGRQVFIRPKTKVSVITMMDGSVFLLHNDRLFALEQIPVRQKVSANVDFDDVKPVCHRKYIPPYDSIWRISNANLFRKKSHFY